MRKLKTAFVGAMFAAVTLAPVGLGHARQRSGRDVKVLGHRNPKGGLGLQMVSVLVASCLCLPGALPLRPPLLGMASALWELAALVVVIPPRRAA